MRLLLPVEGKPTTNNNAGMLDAATEKEPSWKFLGQISLESGLSDLPLRQKC
jgi:hypothetical protein